MSEFKTKHGNLRMMSDRFSLMQTGDWAVELMVDGVVVTRLFKTWMVRGGFKRVPELEMEWSDIVKTGIGLELLTAEELKFMDANYK